MRRRLFHPAASAILLALLLADTYVVSQPGLLGGYSAAGWFVCWHVFGQGLSPSQPIGPPSMLFIRDPAAPGEFRILQPDDESWDQATRDLRDHPRDSLLIRWRPVILRRGFWAPTTAIDRHALEFQFGENFTPEQRAAVRRAYVERSGAAAWLSRRDFQTLATTDIDRTRPILLGYLHNTLAIAALILFLLSLRWVPKAPAYIRARIAAHRLSQGLCPRCRYNLHGLRGSRCPECGAAIPSSPVEGGAAVLRGGGGPVPTSSTDAPT